MAPGMDPKGENAFAPIIGIRRNPLEFHHALA